MVILTRLALLAAAAFLAGSIPFGLLIGKAKGVDLRKVASGNIGATNAMRALGPGLGLIVFGLDIAKGLIPVGFARQWLPTGGLGLDAQAVWMLVGVFAVLGHSFSPWIGFKGGKGVATLFGAAIGAIPLTAAAAFGVFILTTAIWRYISLSSMLAVLSTLPLMILFKDSPQLLGFFVALSVFIFVKHRANWGRIRRGEEPKFAFKKTA